MMPKGAAANLASGGYGPVHERSGNCQALAGARPASSFRSAGSSRTSLLFSGNGGLNFSASTMPSPSPGSRSGLRLPLSVTSLNCSASLRATGAPNASRTGSSGTQPAFAFSRSQEKLTVKLLRTR